VTDPLLQDQIRYLELRLAECLARPELHCCQIAACENQLALARGAATALDYLEAMGKTALEIVRAEWMDRYRNWGRVYAALKSEKKHRAAAMNYRAGEAAGAGDGFVRAVTAAKIESGALHQDAEAGVRLLPALLIALLDWAAECRPEAKEELRIAAATIWDRIQDSDRGCTWERICTDPWYGQRIPFTGARMDILGGWLREVAGESMTGEAATGEATTGEATIGEAATGEATIGEAAPAEAQDSGDSRRVPPAVPTAQQAALAYHFTYAAVDSSDPALQGTRALYERVFAIAEAAGSGPTFLRMMAEDDMVCRLAREPRLAAARAELARCRDAGQPHMEHHYQALIAALQSSRSPTEVEYEIERLGECFAVETAWSEIALRFAMKALVATAQYQGDRSEARRRNVAASYRLVCEFFGKDWDGILATPWVWDFFCKVLFTRGQQLTEAGPGASSRPSLGMVGGPVISVVREAVMGRFMDDIATLQRTAPQQVSEYIAQRRGEPVFATPEALRAYLTELFHEAMGGRDARVAAGPAADAELVLWGQRVGMDDLLAIFADPPRPAVDLT
jgi:hypothetical protein